MVSMIFRLILSVEGIFALHDKETRDLCDLKVFVQVGSKLSSFPSPFE